MSGLFLDPNTHDLVITPRKQLARIQARADQVAQSIKTRFLHVRGEAFTDTREGFPWFTDVLERGVDVNRIKALAGALIRSVPGVVDATVDVELDRETRTAAISWVCRIDTGATIRSADYGPVILPSSGIARP